MDLDTVVAEVAAAVGLAEGEAGVRDILAATASAEPAAVREISQLAELPVPIVAAVCNELRQRGVVDRTRPVRLTAEGRAAVTAGQPDLDATCPACAGRGVVIPEAVAPLLAELEQAAEGGPEAKPELDQTHCTVETKLRRVLRMHAAHALAGQRILLLGDDDLVSLAIVAFAAWTGHAEVIRRLAVVDTDPDVLAWIGKQAARSGVRVDLVEHDLRQPLPAAWPAASTWSPPTRPTRWPARSCSCPARWRRWRPSPAGTCSSRSGPAAPTQTVAVQAAIAQLGLAVRSLTPNFNAYLGAGVLGGTSHLYHLRSTAAARPLITGVHDGALYTADSRAAVLRPYRCASCAAVHEVGPGGRWPRIAVLQAEGCPECGGTVFRPMSLGSRPR